MITIHKTARVSPLADIEDSVRGTKICIGPNTIIDSFVKIKPAGGSGDVLIGENCNINAGCVFYTGNGIRIGNNVAIAANCTFAPTNHAYESAASSIREQGFKPSKGGITIEDDVWIGANCILLDGSIIRAGCVVAAGTIVRKELPRFSIVAGNPARILGYRK